MPLRYILLHSIFFLFVSVSHSISDLEVLLKLKSSMVGPSGSGLDDWNHSSSPSAHCSFSGVTCDNSSQVASLNVSFVPLSGSIPPEIGHLKKLISLTLVASNLTGELPLEMSNLTSIKFINISNNNFSGTIHGSMLAKMTELEVFDVYNNNFSGKLPTEFVKLKGLKALLLGGNYFSGEIPEAYSELQQLESLGLQGNGLTGKIPWSLSRLVDLKELKLGYFNSYEGGIPPEFGLLSSLRVLDMGACNLSGGIPKSLGNLKMLEGLFLQMNWLMGQIPSELSGLISLKELDLSVNELSGELPERLSELKSLTLLNLFGNYFHGPVPSFIGDLPNLETLQIWDNNFTFELPENLGLNGKLQELDVASNHFTGTIPRHLCGGMQLKLLILMDNYFSGPIPEEIGECESLVRVRMMKNVLNGTIPSRLLSLPLLNVLELDDNHFTGELPTQMSAKELEIFSLSINSITGKIPPAIGDLVNLKILSLEMNGFFGEIPEEISNLKKLSKLDISGNNISGRIPTSIVDCPELTSVDLSGNTFDGEIPKGISQLRRLTSLNLSRNHLSGQIPEEMGSMTSLTILDLSYNNFSGRLPSGSQFQYFSDSSFAGNANLCLPHDLSCPSMQASIPRRPSTSFSTTKTALIIVAAEVVNRHWKLRAELQGFEVLLVSGGAAVDFGEWQAVQSSQRPYGYQAPKGADEGRVAGPELATGHMLILTWNCQGIGRTVTSQALGELVRKNRPSIVFLMETKNNKVKVETIRRSLKFDFGFYVEPDGLSGGLALWWNDDVDLEVESASKNLIHSIVNDKSSSSCWATTFVYGSPLRSGRDMVWEDMKDIGRYENLPWLSIGDFNEVLSLEDKLGGNCPSQRRLASFHDMLNYCGLVDLDYKGPKFTWRNNRSGPDCIMERIDMAFANSRWRELFDQALVLVDTAIGSDHNPLILNTQAPLNIVGKSFKFESLWTTEDECREIIQEVWGSNGVGSCMVNFCKKLRGCKVKLKEWHRAKFGDLRFQIAVTKDKLLEVQKQLDEGFNPDLIVAEQELKWKIERFMAEGCHVLAPTVPG
ncbi:hypothetical protein Vadar_032514 [Vaccinium darrowii]|uniref:Uncharacterized protein n=1 Tax=Vaccinium darrowii TaxID=229202 RepID=A0ACB7X6B0_9ERIC|nr:hypothetical protein Vadar_032514 [Vaccinium darrowii]